MPGATVCRSNSFCSESNEDTVPRRFWKGVLVSRFKGVCKSRRQSANRKSVMLLYFRVCISWSSLADLEDADDDDAALPSTRTYRISDRKLRVAIRAAMAQVIYNTGCSVTIWVHPKNKRTIGSSVADLQTLIKELKFGVLHWLSNQSSTGGGDDDVTGEDQHRCLKKSICPNEKLWNMSFTDLIAR